MLGTTIRRLRQEQGLTQVQLAEKSGISQALVSVIESGAIKDPRGSTYERLANALGVTWEELRNSNHQEQEPAA